ncbi:hypothetical protein WCE41_13535 [Luteimonas sp. MJ246]|uniref:hypothetical protein n=1 Tax=Luteimonas sp. MJ174 TaxID=3129237 RepID=UPI0031B9D4D1
MQMDLGMTGRQGEMSGSGQEGLRWTRVGAWCAQAWRIYRVAPLRILLLALAPVVFEGLVQLTPSAGIVLSKLLTPAVSAWVLVMLDCKLRRHGFSPGASGWQTASRWRQVAGLTLVGLLVFSVQMAMAALIGSPAQAMALAVGDIAGIGFSRMEMAGVLASGAAPMLLLFFVGPRMMLDGLRLWPAVLENARLLQRCWQPMVFYSLVMALMLAGLTWMPLLLLVFLPAGLCIGYAAYRDVFDPLPEA